MHNVASKSNSMFMVSRYCLSRCWSPFFDTEETSFPTRRIWWKEHFDPYDWDLFCSLFLTSLSYLLLKRNKTATGKDHLKKFCPFHFPHSIFHSDHHLFYLLLCKWFFQLSISSFCFSFRVNFLLLFFQITIQHECQWLLWLNQPIIFFLVTSPIPWRSGNSLSSRIPCSSSDIDFSGNFVRAKMLANNDWDKEWRTIVVS